MEYNETKYKILALGEIFQFVDYVDDNFHCVSIYTKKNRKYKKGTLFSPSLFFELRKRIKNGYYDLILCATNPFPIHIHDRSLLKNIRNLLHALFFDFASLGLSMLPLLLRDSTVPVAGINSHDKPRIPKEDFYLLKRCNWYFMRELPQNKKLLFLNANKRSNALEAIKDNSFYSEIVKKIRPISLGVSDNIVKYGRGNSKDIDIFFCGDIVNSTVREDGLKTLKRLETEGYNVVCITDRIPFDEFYDYCLRSWLVWSPGGLGWDCFRHYEVALAESVPVSNYPSIARYQPPVEGEHCLYYGIEGDHLYRVIKSALNNKDRLEEMGKAARKHCIRYHTVSKILQHVVETTLLETNQKEK